MDVDWGERSPEKTKRGGLKREKKLEAFFSFGGKDSGRSPSLLRLEKKKNHILKTES